LQSEQNLAGLTRERGLVAAEAIEWESWQIGQTKVRLRHTIKLVGIALRFWQGSGVGTVPLMMGSPFLPEFQEMKGSIPQAAIGGGPTEAPQQACQSQHEFPFHG